TGGECSGWQSSCRVNPAGDDVYALHRLGGPAGRITEEDAAVYNDQRVQQLRAGGEVIDSAEDAVIGAERGVAGARSEQSIGDRTIRVIDDADRSGDGRGKNVGWHV